MPTQNQRTQELLAQEGLESIGQKLYNNINIELSGDPHSARRWVWELLQNAKDVIVGDGEIEINLTDNFVEFSHNGSPFEHDNLLAILSQRSTKAPSYTDDEKQSFFDRLFSEKELDATDVKRFLNTSGRFGTGFMTTYLLSKKISLDSIYSTGGFVKYFNISLDRAAETPDEMKMKVKDSFSSFTDLEQSDPSENCIKEYSEGSRCYTKFTYMHDDDGKKTAEIGIADLHRAIPFTLSFVEKIQTIKVTEYGRTTKYSRLKPTYVGDICIVRIEKESESEKKIIEIAKLSDRYDSLTIAVPVEHIDECKYKILFPDDATPRQFISFPLVGSETFPFPVIINSPLFNPNDSRSHVFLNLAGSPQFDKKISLNRALFQKSVALLKKLLSEASSKDWINIYFLAKSDLPIDVDETWYKDSIQKEIRKEILDAEIVVPARGTKRIKPKDSQFPVFTNSKLNEFWMLCEYLIGDKIPQKDDAEIWKNIVEANTTDWLGADLDFGLEKLLRLIQDEASFVAFSKKYFPSDEDAFRALNEIIRFAENEDKDLLDRKENPLQIFPDQTNESSFRDKRSLNRDEQIPPQIKEVLNIIGDSWYERLIREEITAFERDSKLTVKSASNAIKEKIEKFFAGKLDDAEKAALKAGLFELIGCNRNSEDGNFKTLYNFVKQLFPGEIKEVLPEITDIIDFDYKSCQLWAVRAILTKTAAFGNLSNIAQHLFNETYPEAKGHYSEAELDLKYHVDIFINELIQYAIGFESNLYHLLSEYAIIPNQLNSFCLFNNEIFNDDNIPNELKTILRNLGIDCRNNLLHDGVSVKLIGSHDLKWICGQLDDIVIKEQDNVEFKQPIRELDKWISKQGETQTRMDELFKSFNRKRSGIVLNTYGLDERNQFDEILQSGLSKDFADIVKSGAKPETIRELAAISKDIDLNAALSIIKKHPKLTSDRIDRLLELEELSKGWDTEITYSPSDEQIRINFENGWKGEAYVYKELKKKGLEVEWMNLSEVANNNSIIDFEGETHYIVDRGDKYDLKAKHLNGPAIYLQVKATTTDISNADYIALPISTREWKFVFETNDNESYYLARVFNVNSAAPELYLMKLEKSQEL